MPSFGEIVMTARVGRVGGCSMRLRHQVERLPRAHSGDAGQLLQVLCRRGCAPPRRHR